MHSQPFGGPLDIHAVKALDFIVNPDHALPAVWRAARHLCCESFSFHSTPTMHSRPFGGPHGHPCCESFSFHSKKRDCPSPNSPNHFIFQKIQLILSLSKPDFTILPEKRHSIAVNLPVSFRTQLLHIPFIIYLLQRSFCVIFQIVNGIRHFDFQNK